MMTEEDEAFQELERKLERKLPRLFNELNIGNRLVLRFYPRAEGLWNLTLNDEEFKQIQEWIDEAFEDKKLQDKPFAHVMVYENDVKHCVTADTKGAVPVYTKEKL